MSLGLLSFGSSPQSLRESGSLGTRGPGGGQKERLPFQTFPTPHQPGAGEGCVFEAVPGR